MNQRAYSLLLVLIMIGAAGLDYVLRGALPLWVRAPVVGLSVGLVVLTVGFVLKRKNKQKV